MFTSRPAGRFGIRLSLAASLLMVGCGSERAAESLQQWMLESGEPLAAMLSSGSDTSVVLVYDPAECFSCDGQLSRWVQLGQQRGWPIRLVLTRTPTAAERNQLLLYRLPPDGVVRGAADGLATPRVYRFAREALVDSAVGDAEQHLLLERSRGAYEAPRFGDSQAPFSGTVPSTNSQENTR